MIYHLFVNLKSLGIHFEISKFFQDFSKENWLLLMVSFHLKLQENR